MLANELLDNLPFRLAVHDGAWREAYVVAERDGTFGEVLSAPFDPLPAVLPATAGHGARAPLLDAAAAWVAEAAPPRGSGVRWSSSTTSGRRRPCSPPSSGGRGCGRTAATSGDATRWPIRASRTSPSTSPSTSCRSPTPSARRTSSCSRWGIDELVDDGRRAWQAAAAAPDLAALRMRSRPTEAAALLDPSGLGGFGVVQWIAPFS